MLWSDMLNAALGRDCDDWLVSWFCFWPGGEGVLMEGCEIIFFDFPWVSVVLLVARSSWFD